MGQTADGFRYHIFDPFLVIGQIITLQAIFYVVLCVAAYLTAAGIGEPVSLALIFTSVITNTWAGYICYVTSAIIMGVLSGWVVQRARQCLDFALTMHIIHFTASCSYDTCPRSLGWWLLNIACVAITASVAEYVSMNINTGAIQLNVGNNKKQSDVPLL
eukprot:m.42664 g.42664  ORF g.42664 m.42664 type:complete len:160 (+) comp9897_c0_seq1:206-685(+)